MIVVQAADIKPTWDDNSLLLQKLFEESLGDSE